MSRKNRMPGLRQKGGYWYIEKRCKHAAKGWLRESTGCTSRSAAEQILIRRLAELEEEAKRRDQAIFTFEDGALRHIEEVAEKPSADDIALHVDQLLPFIGDLPLAHIHDGTLKAFIEHEQRRGLAPKSVNNALDVVIRVLNKAARSWRDEQGRPWLRQAPAKISQLAVKGKQKKPYIISWAEQDRLIKELPAHLQGPVLYGVNTGCREQEICGLRWDWEVWVAEHGMSVFVLPEDSTKTKTARVVVLNAIARSVIEAQRGKHEERVFTYRGRPIGKLNNTAWKRAWRAAGLPVVNDIRRGVHNLRHTCGQRMRAAGVSRETRSAVLGHADGHITTHYSAAELEELINAVEKITKRGKTNSPNLLVIGRKDVGKLSEKEKGLTENLG